MRCVTTRDAEDLAYSHNPTFPFCVMTRDHKRSKAAKKRRVQWHTLNIDLLWYIASFLVNLKDLQLLSWMGKVRLCDLNVRRWNLPFCATNVEYSPKGRFLVVAGSLDGDVSSKQFTKLIDPTTGRVIRTLNFKRFTAPRVAVSPVGHLVATSGQHDDVFVWNSKTGEKRWRFCQGRGNLQDVVFSRDGRIIVAAWERVVVAFCVQEGRLLWSRYGRWCNSVASCPNTQTLACVIGDAVELMDIKTGVVRTSLRGHIEAIVSVAYSADGKMLASASADRTVILWDASTGERVRTLSSGTECVRSAAFFPDGRTLAVNTSHRLVLLDVATGCVKAAVKGGCATYSQSLSFSPDGMHLAVGSDEKGCACVYSTRHLNSLTTIEAEFVPGPLYVPGLAPVRSSSGAANVRGMYDSMSYTYQDATILARFPSPSATYAMFDYPLIFR